MVPAAVSIPARWQQPILQRQHCQHHGPTIGQQAVTACCHSRERIVSVISRASSSRAAVPARPSKSDGVLNVGPESCTPNTPGRPSNPHTSISSSSSSSHIEQVIAPVEPGRSSSSSSSSSSHIEQVIAPVDPSRSRRSSTIPLTSLPSSVLDGTAAAAAAAAKRTSTRAPNARHDSRRGSLVKIRVAPRRYRLRKSFDQPRRIWVDPMDPAFEGRLTSEINSCYGPRQLTKLIHDYGPNLTAGHCAAAISLLAGMVTGKQLQPQQLQATYQAPAATAAKLLTRKIKQATLLDCARAVYGLARLQLHMPQLLPAVEAHTAGQLSCATPQVLAGIAAGLAHWGHRPGDGWVQELCTEAFAQMSSFGAQDLANLVFALACWRKSCSQPFLLRCLSAFRGHWGSAGCHAPTLVRFVYAVTQLPPCQPLPPGMLKSMPEGSAVYQHHDEWRREKEQHEMNRVMGVKEDAAAAAGPAAGAASEDSGWTTGQKDKEDLENPNNSSGSRSSRSSGSSSSSSSSSRGRAAAVAAATTYRLPSFNWLVAFLAECRRQIDKMKPAELSTLLWSMACLNHTPDLIFMECWYRASAVHMHAFTPQTLAAALQALGMLQPGKDVPGGVSGRWLQLVLNQSEQLLEACSGPELSKLLWGFAELRFWPGQAWMDKWQEAAEQQLPSMNPSDLSDTVWALARMRYSPAEPWIQTLATAISTNLPGFTAQGLAAVIWGFTRLGLKPDRAWLMRFKASSGAQLDGESADKLARFVAGLLAQQNRQRFSSRSSSGGGGSLRLPKTAH